MVFIHQLLSKLIFKCFFLGRELSKNDVNFDDSNFAKIILKNIFYHRELNKIATLFHQKATLRKLITETP